MKFDIKLKMKLNIVFMANNRNDHSTFKVFILNLIMKL